VETETSLNTGAIKHRRGRPRRRPLRGARLISAARIALAEMVNLSPKTHPINVSTLSKRIGVTRQAIYNNDLLDEISKHSELQRQNYSDATEITALRRPLEERQALLERENKELRSKLDGWIQRWVEVEYNAKMHGYDADLLFASMPLPLRKTLGFRTRKKKI
jgi:hypothetical protein